jgi:hypothetical protein
MYITRIKEFFRKPSTKDLSDPVYAFFVETKSHDRKRVYMKALRGAQHDQEKISRMSKENARA